VVEHVAEGDEADGVVCVDGESSARDEGIGIEEGRYWAIDGMIRCRR
jgi:hypothetical protein